MNPDLSDRPPVRLNKFIAESGVCSRREADRFIEEGKVWVNGQVAEMGTKVTAEDEVKLNGKLIKPQNKERFAFIAFNKPVGIVSTTDSAEPNNLLSVVKHSQRVFPIGRLDKDSQGLLFMTSNGDLVNKILRAGNAHEKEYIVTVDKPITQDFIRGMGNGVPILGQMTKKCKVTMLSRFVFRIILVQGLNRQIRRMAEHFGYRVKKLERIRIMHIKLGDIAPGTWRELTPAELDTLMKAIAHSSSEAPPGHRRKAPAKQAARPTTKKPRSKPQNKPHIQRNKSR
ncbi:23S rRNA pseudouridine(2604) synthase RluF [Aliidiomarina celeris]|uniref:23S rRNA pseudouridine(2604) synthase RluF n=1 Tax=Aliidiomarina celeris TaxID=2249428 RepID=UPI000DEA0316|nr:23S rRNA pseudouridine(2604) synthase RluF [Aliidiomarina celeris]